MWFWCSCLEKLDAAEECVQKEVLKCFIISQLIKHAHGQGFTILVLFTVFNVSEIENAFSEAIRNCWFKPPYSKILKLLLPDFYPGQQKWINTDKYIYISIYLHFFQSISHQLLYTAVNLMILTKRYESMFVLFCLFYFSLFIFGFVSSYRAKSNNFSVAQNQT